MKSQHELRAEVIALAKIEIAKAHREIDPDIFKKALEKYRRWLRAAHGAVCWEEAEEDAICFYYEETLARPSGRKTFNRGYN